MPLQATAGTVSYDAYGSGAAVVAANYIEDVFQTWLYTGNDSTQTITNGVDLAGKGGLTWIKVRDYADSHRFFDTNRGVGNYIASNSTSAQLNNASSVTAFNSNGFSLGNFSGTNGTAFGSQYASWTFRKQPKFFDVVTYTGDGVTNRAVTHSLGSTPGCIIVKRTDTATDWYVYHRSSNSAWTGGTTAGVTTGGNATGQLKLNQAGAFNAFGGVFTYINSTAFGVNFDDSSLNVNGGTYVAYIFAHNAGGFGASGTDNVISCGSFTTGGSYTVGEVNLGYEPQWAMIKRVDSTGDWSVADIMRGMPGGNNFTQKTLNPNLSSAEQDATVVSPNSTGFSYNFLDLNATYIYIAIRRGPMRTPTTGTSVFTTVLQTPASSGTSRTIGFPADFIMAACRNISANRIENTRLTGFANTSGALTNTPAIFLNLTNAESNTYPLFYDVWNTTAKDGDYFLGANAVNWFFRRAPGFFDVVCYTSDNTYAVINHNLGVVPQLVIQKRRDGTSNWFVTTGAQVGYLELTDAFFNFSRTFTSTTFQPATTGPGYTYVAYLFATVAGVSKVGSYTGTGTTLQVNCGFTGGARFVLIKRTDSTGDWYVWDSARGISSGNDPYLLLNSTATEDTATNYVDTDTTGFKVTAAAPAGLNANGGTFIFLAVA